MAQAVVISDIHKALVGLVPRSEKSSDTTLVETFVDTEPFIRLLSRRNNQVIYGRRGTGKTHALKFLKEQVESSGDRGIYVDLLKVGSNSSIYGDGSRSLSIRAGTLIHDVLLSIYDELYTLAVSLLDKVPDYRQVTIRLDDLMGAISEVRITGSAEKEVVSGRVDAREETLSASGRYSINPQIETAASEKTRGEYTKGEKLKRSGVEELYLNFGRVSDCLDGLIVVLGRPHLWLLSDEWSEVPIELQPYLADLLRRIVLPQTHVTVKIAAIEHRSNMAITKGRGERIGLELGADIAAELNLDDFLVFDSNPQKSISFFKDILFKHFKSSPLAPTYIRTANDLISSLFTQYPAFEDFVLAAEGVPRDAIYIFESLLTKAWGERFTKEHVRASARDWYNREKSKILRERSDLNDLMLRIIEEVIGKRRARAFLYKANTRNILLEELFDARLLHILKKNISSNDEPGNAMTCLESTMDAM